MKDIGDIMNFFDIINQIEEKFGILINHIDVDTIIIPEIDFTYEIIEFLEEITNTNVDFYYVYDDTTFVEITIEN